MAVAASGLVPPSDVLVVPMVTAELVRAEFGMLVNVFDEPDMDLLVSVSVVARPTKVSVLVGRVSVPVLTMVEMTGAVSVLLVSVCVPVKVTTVESMAIVTGAEPLNEPPLRPVPIVRVLVVLAVIVPDAPKATVTPL